MKHAGGRPPNAPSLEREYWAARFGLSHQAKSDLTKALMVQLSLCKGDEQRRLILGVSS